MTTPTLPGQTGIVPAQLGFLTIFNPSLGVTDETMDDQIVYYASVNARSQKRRHRSRGKLMSDVSQEERNERLRQIGLAQGMVELSRGFANGQAVDMIETEKTRVVLQEVEPGWWILASIDLTRIPLPPRIGPPGVAGGRPLDSSDNVDYSARELKPSTLLMRDLLRAHSLFLLHHASSLSALFVKSKRTQFVKLLGRFWDLFLSTWDVMLHGNPARDIVRGIKMAACGELGVGVGEEDRGSGEREVLEGFVGRIEGLTDLVVSKFGPSESPPSDAEPVKDGSSGQWLATGEEPGAEDGAIFLGVGALSRKSLLDVTCWMEDLYIWGENAYGVKESPMSTRQGKKRQKSVPNVTDSVGDLSQSRDRASTVGHGSNRDATTGKSQESEPAASSLREAAEEGGLNRFMSYLKMGYGTHWTLGGSDDGAVANTTEKQNTKQKARAEDTPRKPLDASGHFLIGLLGDLDEVESGGGESQANNPPNDDSGASTYNSRIPLRTLTVELEGPEPADVEIVKDLGSQSTELTETKSAEAGSSRSSSSKSQFDSQDRNKTQKMRVVVYVNKPFIFTFLFRNRTDSLALGSFYRSLHRQLVPLRKPLAVSTTYRPERPDLRGDGEGEGEPAHIFDLIWDPRALTVHSTIPSIPTSNTTTPVWTRAEAVNTHNQILNMYAATQGKRTELERTCKTSRGWWVVWTRLPEYRGSADGDDDAATATATASDTRDPRGGGGGREIFLVRRSGDTAGLRGRSSSYTENGASWAEGAGRLAHGIGVDTQRYVEGLLRLGR
ncbi:hypothetical protein GGR50DRAFT_680218 [Xylaria sp. CBS 124048]|nr:hypothetical protein GGR50DRAFT_680218 [Xylaria sp. CBS 124048]